MLFAWTKTNKKDPIINVGLLRLFESQLIKESLLPPRLLHPAVFNGRLEAELFQELFLHNITPWYRLFCA